MGDIPFYRFRGRPALRGMDEANDPKVQEYLDRHKEKFEFVHVA